MDGGSDQRSDPFSRNGRLRRRSFRKGGCTTLPRTRDHIPRPARSGGVIGTRLSIMGFSRHTNDRRASEGENGIGLVSPRTKASAPDARKARQRQDLVSANVKRRTVRYRLRQLRKELDESAFAAYIRGKSGFLPWILAFCFVGAHIQVADFVRGEPEYRPTPQDQVARDYGEGSCSSIAAGDRSRDEGIEHRRATIRVGSAVAQVLVRGQFHPVCGGSFF